MVVALKPQLYMGGSLNWGPFSGPVYRGAELFLGPKKGPQFRELPI